MEPFRTNISAESIIALADILPESGSLNRFRSRFQTFVAQHGWDWFPLHSKRDFNHRARLLYIAFHRVRYAANRLRQLEDCGYAFWIFRSSGCDCSYRQALDGFTLPPSSPLWSIFSPPLDWECTCYITGARSRRGIARLGGIFDKRPHDLGEWIEPMWRDPVGPDLRTILEALAHETIPPPP